MPRLPRSDRTNALGFTPARTQADRIDRITAGWADTDPRWHDLKALLRDHAQDVRTHEAARIRRHADDPKVKPHLLEGEWTGLRMAADLLHLER